MTKYIFFILEGSQGATYILNVKDSTAISSSFKFYKARTLKQKLMKTVLNLYLHGLCWLGNVFFLYVLHDKNGIDSYLNKITNLNFDVDENSSILISPTRDKIIVHHHGQYFQKFAFNNSYKKVNNEVRIYDLLDKPLQYFEVSKFHDYVEYGNGFCSFKLVSLSKRINSDINLMLALVEMFNVSRVDGYLFSSYLEGLKKRCSKSAVIHESIGRVLNKLEVTHKNVGFSVGLVHRDFKPWNINDEHGLLIYDFEEAVTDGLPLEDLLNYHIDPIVRYLPTLNVVKHIFKKERIKEYKRYLVVLGINIDFHALLYCYLIERIIFWMNAGKKETSKNYYALFEYIVMEYEAK